jgi:hypothetical protein
MIYTVAYLCKIVIIGSPFITFDESVAKEWVAQDPIMNYYDKVPVVYNL